MCEYNYKEALERLRQDGFTVLETERLCRLRRDDAEGGLQDTSRLFCTATRSVARTFARCRDDPVLR